MIQGTLVGRLCNDPEAKEDKNGKTYAKFTLACQKDKDNADFIFCQAYGQSANVVLDFCKKGNQLVAVGRLNLNTFPDKEGFERTVLNCNISSVALVGSKGENSSEGDSKPKRRKVASATTQQAEQEFDPYA